MKIHLILAQTYPKDLPRYNFEIAALIVLFALKLKICFFIKKIQINILMSLKIKKKLYK